jgi:hypothetical protein
MRYYTTISRRPMHVPGTALNPSQTIARRTSNNIGCRERCGTRSGLVQFF